MARCWSCRKVKGRRPCPARGGELICSRCCGTKRRIEIRCPSDCSYLHGAHDAKWTSRSQEKEETRFFQRFLALEESTAFFSLFLHHVLTNVQNPLSSLEDQDLLDVARTALKTLETGAKGVLYSHQTQKLQLQPAAEWLVKLVSSRERIQGAPDVSDQDVLVALRAFASAVEEHAREGGRRGGYLDLARTVMAEMNERSAPVLLPDELIESPSRLIVTS